MKFANSRTSLDFNAEHYKKAVKLSESFPTHLTYAFFCRVFPDMVPWDTWGFAVWYTAQFITMVVLDFKKFENSFHVCLWDNCAWRKEQQAQFYHRFPTWQQFNKSLLPIQAKAFHPLLRPKACFMETTNEHWWKEKLYRLPFFSFFLSFFLFF